MYRKVMTFIKGQTFLHLLIHHVYDIDYKASHSTESALLRIKSDIHHNLSKGTCTALTLLDLSAAFDTIDHSILLNRLG